MMHKTTAGWKSGRLPRLRSPTLLEARRWSLPRPQSWLTRPGSLANVSPIFNTEGRFFVLQQGATMSIRRSASALALLFALILTACGSSASLPTQVPTAAPPTQAPTSAPPTQAPPTAAPATAAPTAAPPTEVLPTAVPATAQAAPAPASAGVTITDAAGRTVTVASAERLISLAPSTTEILFAIGLGPKVLATD